MPSDAQIAANRANALRSTGPRTPEGKSAASLNNLRHGLVAERFILPTENPDEFRAFADPMFEALAPDGPLEACLAERVVAGAWRLRRALRVEQEILLWLGSKPAEGDAPARFVSETYALWQDGKSKHKAFEKLGRHEARLHRQFSRDLAQLRDVQRSRPARLSVAVLLETSPCPAIPLDDPQTPANRVISAEASSQPQPSQPPESQIGFVLKNQ